MSNVASVVCAVVDADDGGFAANVDCDDTYKLLNPAATEVCDNGIDDHCDGNGTTPAILSASAVGQLDARSTDKANGDDRVEVLGGTLTGTHIPTSLVLPNHVTGPIRIESSKR
ncbi:MAG: hypothetical protein ACI9MC_001632 [Kiritimatiellia bacterium]|jgi:hypothetical protein